MPDSLSSTTSPVGIIISPGTSRTTATKLWAYLWTAEREAEHEAWHHRLPQVRDPRTPDTDVG